MSAQSIHQHARPAADRVRTPDRVLSRRAGLGDRKAFALVVTRYGPGLYRYIFRLLDNPSDAEDILQETFLDAWKGRGGFRGDAALQTWLFTLARRRVYAHYRHAPEVGHRGHVDVDDVIDRLPARDADPAGTHQRHDLLVALDLALRMLPPRQRSVWLLREIEGFTYVQIATVMAVTPDAVRGLLERARAALVITLKEWR
ncbi:RNA polymerase sigma factor [Cryptosporangium arvum]|uniref:RNA polymerase sigma factor n=1 Tax=Cryptosporangium arvum TaxID=80871 RepID=UPI0004BB374A|nr:sigma-70 family RNA polymerase sigma factor [Cryptosporangium arvum]